ncbi:MAG: glutathione S-transferase family protein [Planctomycetota bacterium]
MKLYLTPLSHFSRKVVIVATELGLEFERKYVPDLLSNDPQDFGGNPILRVPVWEDGEDWILESDAIVGFLIDRYGGGDRLGYRGLSSPQRNALSLLNAIMAAEVELVLSARSGCKRNAFFVRYEYVIERSLGWLEQHGEAIWTSTPFSYLDVVLVCMWDHLQHSGVLPVLPSCRWIGRRVRSFDIRPNVRESSPVQMQDLQWQLYPSQGPS